MSKSSGSYNSSNNSNSNSNNDSSSSSSSSSTTTTTTTATTTTTTTTTAATTTTTIDNITVTISTIKGEPRRPLLLVEHLRHVLRPLLREETHYLFVVCMCVFVYYY